MAADNLYDIKIFDSDVDDLEDLEIINYITRPRRPKSFGEKCKYYFHQLDDGDFFIRFRLQKPTVLRLLIQIEHSIETPTDRNRSISPAGKLLLTLRYYAVGTVLLAMAGFSGVSKTSACSIIKQVSVAIASNRPNYVYIPTTEEERKQTVLGFYKTAKFPNVIGAIDCTHIRIQSPGGDYAEHYRNHKGYFSWNVQTVCDGNLRILDIVARWPGSTHDQTIFNNSVLKRRFENGEVGNFLLVGDSGYEITNYLITPLQNPVTPAETLFNESQIRTRNAVERSYGMWKKRFPILVLGMRASPDKCKVIIVATAVLHNLAIMEKEIVPPIDPVLRIEDAFFNEDQPAIVPQLPAHMNGKNCAKRRTLIDNYFSNLV